jgi:hypothetical protein
MTKSAPWIVLALVAVAACRKDRSPAAAGADAADARSIVEPDVAAPEADDDAAVPDAAQDAQEAETGPAPTAAPVRTSAADSAANVRRLSPAELPGHRPKFSPDGQRVLFYAGEDGAADVYVIAVDGSGLVRLTDDPADDRDPTWDRDGDEILWSTNRGGRGYDLWRMRADGSHPQPFTDIPGDELEPTVSPLRYRFYAVSLNMCVADGADGDLADEYDKAAFTRKVRGRSEVWFQSLNVVHRGRVSAEGSDCFAPAWSGNGLALAWACAAADGSVVLHSEARWDQTFKEALASVGATWERSDGFCTIQDERYKNWRDDPCFSTLPRHYSSYDGRARSDAATALRDPAYSANQTLLVAAPAEGPVHWALRDDEGPWAPLAGLPDAARRPAWSPDGTRLAFESSHEGPPGVYLADTDFYLQQVRDLVDYPELYGKGRSDRLHRNGFVARPGTEREFHRLYEQLHYQRRAVFVTADAALQVFHDEFARLLRDAESLALAGLRSISTALYQHYAARAARGGTPQDRYYAVYFGVPHVFLEAAARVEPSFAQEFWDNDPEYAAEFRPAAEQLPALARARGEDLLPGVRDEILQHVEAALAHAGIGEIRPPDRDRPIPVDFTQFAIRGHYATSPLAGYFLAVKWYGLVPLPLDASVFELVRTLDATPAPAVYPRMTDPSAAADPPIADGTVGEMWNAVDDLIGTFLGRPVDATVVHLRQVAREHPAWATDPPRQALVARLEELVGTFRFRGLEGGLSGEVPALRCSFVPQRYGLDEEFFSRLSDPTLPERTMVTALDVFAGLGSATATEHALESQRGAKWFETYRTRLAELAAETAGRPASYWATDLYHSWLAALAALARPLDLPADSPLTFARTPAWRDRLLYSALAGYAQLKHDAVLYAMQEMGAECDSDRPAFLYIEQPVLPEPRGYVDPVPEFFRALAELARRVYRELARGEAPLVEYFEPVTYERRETNAGAFVERLAGLAEREVRGEPLSPADDDWLRWVGGMLELLYTRANPETTHFPGADEGRIANGVALATDVFTDLRHLQVLQLALGRIHDLYVAVPDGVGQRMTQGGIQSYYEFRQPMTERLTDEAWGRRVAEGRTPPFPDWSQSFLEPVPEGAARPEPPREPPPAP